MTSAIRLQVQPKRGFWSAIWCLFLFASNQNSFSTAFCRPSPTLAGHVHTATNRQTLPKTTALSKSSSIENDAKFAKYIFEVALTRESGKNDKLLKEIVSHPDLNHRVQHICLPCIAHGNGPDYDALPSALQDFDWDWVAVTSPEAARVLAEAWRPFRECGNNQKKKKSEKKKPPCVCAVGAATCDALRDLGIDVAFVPSKATALSLVDELPGEAGQTVLYPASAQAAVTLPEGLTARGFDVTRLDTYDTVAAAWTGAEKGLASNVRVACFGSPSAVAGWLENTNGNTDVLAACIGETSAAACRVQGWAQDHVFFPDKPGVKGWVAAIEAAVDSLEVAEELRAEQSQQQKKKR
jgi:uroporphyrinogen-III synthase